MHDPNQFDQAYLDARWIAAALDGTIFAAGMHHFPTIGSTNTYALEQASLDAPHGSWYIADEQTAGRGRSDHAWHSAPGQGLYLSVLIRPNLIGPNLTAPDLVWLPLLTGLAAHRAIREVTALAPDLRWPNDLLIGPRKVGGILTEAQIESQIESQNATRIESQIETETATQTVARPECRPGSTLERVTSRATAAVLGIGINLHQRSFPPGLATQPTSLDLETGRTSSRADLLVAFLEALDDELAGLDDPDALRAIPRRIAAISSWVEGRPVEVHGPQACSGITAGLDARGFLRVRTDAGDVTITTGGLRAASHRYS